MDQPQAELPLPPESINDALRAGVLSARVSRDQFPDLLQDAWVAFLRHRERLADISPDALVTYIQRIGRSAAIDSLRAMRAHHPRRLLSASAAGAGAGNRAG